MFLTMTSWVPSTKAYMKRKYQVFPVSQRQKLAVACGTRAILEHSCSPIKNDNDHHNQLQRSA